MVSTDECKLNGCAVLEGERYSPSLEQQEQYRVRMEAIYAYHRRRQTMPKRAILSLTVHSDPGHGWLEIPKSLVFSLGIAREISDFSYELGNLLFLEWDRDAEVAFQALKDRGYAYQVESRSYEDYCDIPTLRAFQA